MIHQGTFQSADGLHLFKRNWTPSNAARAVVVLVHGYAEHSGRYEHAGAYLARQGFILAAYDQRGYGRSEGRRAYVDAFVHYLDDLGRFLETVRRETPDIPLFILGHSMGGAVAVRYVLDREAAFAGLILSSPYLAIPDHVAPLLRKIAGFLGRWTPRLPTLRLDLDLLSSDPAVAARAKADPLYFHGRLPARTGAELASTVAYIGARMDAITLPLLIIHGTADGIADPQGSIALYEQAVASDKTLALYPDLYHETLNEPEQYRVLDEIRLWLEEHVSGSDDGESEWMDE